MASGSKLVLFAALGANLGIGVAKFVAAAITGSSAMLTEGVHSVVDSLNQVLLLHGQRRSQKPADTIHPLGYGRELYFWSFVVAILIFAIGAGLSVYEGVLHILHPVQGGSVVAAYVVLAISFALESGSWVVAMREFAAAKHGQGWWQAIRRSKDPTTFIVLFEDSAAILGLVIAAAGIALEQVTGNPVWDGAASVLIGAVLALVALVLARESKGLLIGERADPALGRAVREAFTARSEVTGVNDVITVHLAPDKVFVAVSVDFEDATPVGRVEQLVAEVEGALRRDWPQIAGVFVKPEGDGAGAGIST